ncbi:acid protease [Panus rudis PR-1116 ss-1]|nr:acid protease [Panus rudis PR-1116 ss-1]
MFPPFFVSLLFLVDAIASPVVIRDSPITLSVARRFNLTGAANMVKMDQARAKALKTRPKVQPHNRTTNDAVFGVPATNQAVDYVLNVGVGSPPTNFSLLIDTGSSNTWVGAGKAFTVTDTTQITPNLVAVQYGSGFVIGQEVVDQVTLAPGLVIENQSLGVALEDAGFDGVDGIVGIGPTDLTCGTLFPEATACIPTVTDNAFSQGLIDSALVGISFEPTTDLSVTNGEISFGGVDTSKFTGDINFVPITTTSPASEFVGIDQSIAYGAAKTPILATTSGITDTGTTLLLIASDALATYQSLTGAVPDNNTGLLRLTPDQFSNLESLFFTIGDETFEFTPNAQAWPRALNAAIGGTDDFVYLIVGDIGSLSGEGLDFIDGMTFLERFYTVFDSAGSRFGIATTPFTDAMTN